MRALETGLRYQETKAQSAELLRQAIALMGQHDAAYNPISFAVWYEFAAGINHRLTQAVGRAIAQCPRLADADIQRLYQESIADADPAALRRVSDELQKLMSGLAAVASQTGHQAGNYNQQLRGLSDALLAHDAAVLTPMVQEVLAGTLAMRQSAQSLEQQVQTHQAEIDELRAALERARDEAVIDPLTQVLNRRGFEQKLSDILARPPASDSAHCLIMLDIDHFKKVNDTYGHVMGDRVIQALGEVIRTTLPATQTQAVAARYGGEEFAVLLPDSTLERSVRVADALRQRVSAMKVRDRRTQEVMLSVSISGGVAARRGDEHPHEFIARADAALYQSKEKGRNRVTSA